MLLCDYVLEYEGNQLPLSEPEPGPACEHHGGHLSFGVPAYDLQLAEEMAGHTARLTTAEGELLGRFHVEHFDPELFILSGDMEPPVKADAHQGRGAFAAVLRTLRRLGLWEPGDRTPRRPRTARN